MSERPDSRRQVVSLPCHDRIAGSQRPCSALSAVSTGKNGGSDTVLGSHFFCNSDPAVLRFSGVDLCPDHVFPKQNTSVMLILGVPGPGGIMKHTEATALVSAHLMSNPLTTPLKYPWGQERVILGIGEISQLVKRLPCECEDTNLIPKMCYSSKGERTTKSLHN